MLNKISDFQLKQIEKEFIESYTVYKLAQFLEEDEILEKERISFEKIIYKLKKIYRNEKDKENYYTAETDEITNIKIKKLKHLAISNAQKYLDINSDKKLLNKFKLLNNNYNSNRIKFKLYN